MTYYTSIILHLLHLYRVGFKLGLHEKFSPFIMLFIIMIMLINFMNLRWIILCMEHCSEYITL